MKKPLTPAIAFVVGGFVANAFTGALNPIYITQILASLDPRVIAAGSVLSSVFPVVVGLALERKSILKRLYALLPLVMVAELALTALSAAVASVDLAAYYLFSMLVFGVFSSSVLYLLQKLKESRVRRDRAAFDRRVAIADGLGYLTGSAVGYVAVASPLSPAFIAVLGALQTGVVYAILVCVYRRVPQRRRAERATEQEPHPCRSYTVSSEADSPCLLAA